MAKKRDIYTLKDGSPCDWSVSQLCGILDKPQLVPWAAKMTAQAVASAWQPGVAYSASQIEEICMEAKKAHRVAKDSAGDLGTRVHLIVGAYVEGQLMPDGISDPGEKKSLENFIRVTQGWEWLGSEITLVSEEHRYGGTADAIARINGVVHMIDFKTSNSVYPTYSMQCALYAKGTPDDPALQAVWKEIKEARILHWNKEFFTWEVLERNIEEQYPYIPAFVACAAWKKRFETKSYATPKDDAIKVSPAGDTTFRSDAAPVIEQYKPAASVFIA